MGKVPFAPSAVRHNTANDGELTKTHSRSKGFPLSFRFNRRNSNSRKTNSPALCSLQALGVNRNFEPEEYDSVQYQNSYNQGHSAKDEPLSNYNATHQNWSRNEVSQPYQRAPSLYQRRDSFHATHQPPPNSADNAAKSNYNPTHQNLYYNEPSQTYQHAPSFYQRRDSFHHPHQPPPPIQQSPSFSTYDSFYQQTTPSTSFTRRDSFQQQPPLTRPDSFHQLPPPTPSFPRLDTIHRPQPPLARHGSYSQTSSHQPQRSYTFHHQAPQAPQAPPQYLNYNRHESAQRAPLPRAKTYSTSMVSHPQRMDQYHNSQRPSQYGEPPSPYYSSPQHYGPHTPQNSSASISSLKYKPPPGYPSRSQETREEPRYSSPAPKPPGIPSPAEIEALKGYQIRKKLLAEHNTKSSGASKPPFKTGGTNPLSMDEINVLRQFKRRASTPILPRTGTRSTIL